MPHQLVSRLQIMVAGAAIAALAVASTGRAQEQPVPGASSIQQYVEALPTGGGSSVPGVTESTQTPLPPAAVDALKYAPPEIASVLEEVATSSEYGAPRSPATGPTGEPGDAPASSAVWRAVDAIGTGSDTRLLGLVAVLLAVTVGAGVLAVRRARA